MRLYGPISVLTLALTIGNAIHAHAQVTIAESPSATQGPAHRC